MAEPLSMWTVYRQPADYPDHYVARRWLVGTGPEPVATRELLSDVTLEGLRALLPLGLTCIHRHPNDDPTIVEVWL